MTADAITKPHDQLSDRIPEEVLAREHRRFLRMAAALMVKVMAEDDIDFATMDARLGRKPGWSQRMLTSYITCKSKDGRMFTDLICALGGRLEMAISRLQFAAQPIPEEPIETAGLSTDAAGKD